MGYNRHVLPVMSIVVTRAFLAGDLEGASINSGGQHVIQMCGGAPKQ